jgi:uncharacterized protein
LILPDVNVLVQAYRSDAPEHALCRNWLQEAANGPELLGLSDLVLSGVVRVMTHPRVFVTPTPVGDLLAALSQLRDSPGVATVKPGPRHWRIFCDLCTSARARGNLVPDAYHAALAIEHGATWVTLDRDFARFPGLRWVSPG